MPMADRRIYFTVPVNGMMCEEIMIVDAVIPKSKIKGIRARRND